MQLDNRQIKAFEAKGARRWTKGGHDRLYIKPELIGLECDYYRSGNVRSARWLGEGISNSDARRIKGYGIYIEIKTGDLHVDSGRWADDIREQAETFVAEALAELPELTPVEASEDYGAAVAALANGVARGEYTYSAYYVAVCGICERFGRGSWVDANHDVRDIVRAISGMKRMPLA